MAAIEKNWPEDGLCQTKRTASNNHVRKPNKGSKTVPTLFKSVYNTLSDELLTVNYKPLPI